MAGIDVRNEVVRSAITDEVHRTLAAAEAAYSAPPEIKWGRDGSAEFLFFAEPVFDPAQTPRLMRAFHGELSKRVGALSLGQTVWNWAAGRLLGEAGKPGNRATLLRPSPDESPAQGVEISVVEFPVNVGTDGWRGLNIQFSGIGSSPEFTTENTLVAWPYDIQPDVAKSDTSILNSLKFQSAPADIGGKLLTWLLTDMREAEPKEKILERRKAAELEFAKSKEQASDAYARMFPGNEYPGDMFAKISVVGRLVYEAWAADHGITIPEQ